jgi:MFS family permease
MPSTTGPRLTRALRHRNFRLFFGGQSISLVGTWITRVATSWLIYRLTGSELLLGIAGFCGQIPTLLITPFAGVLVDRMDRRRMLVVTQAASLGQSALLAILTLAGHITVTQIVVLQVLQGIINAFDTPARQAFVSEMVDNRRDLPNAIALNSSMVNGSRIIGPSVGGLLIAGFGEGWCFAIDAVSYLGVIASLLAMHVTPRERHEVSEMRVLDELSHGWRYILGHVPIRTALLMVAVVSTAGTPYSVLMPAIASQELAGGPNTLGILMAASGVGALTGALYLALRESVLGLQHLPPDHRPGAAARPGDVVLHHGVLRHRADREPDWRRDRGTHRCAADGGDERSGLPGGWWMVRVAPARHPRAGAAGLSRDGDSHGARG